MNDRLILFDGICGLCNFAVDWIVEHDPQHVFRFAPLQGATAAQFLSESERTALSSLIYVENGQTYRKSDAVLKIASHLPSPWRWFVVAKVVPKFIRDFVYTVIAKSRYRIWGRRETCRLPTKEERALFLD